MYKFCTLKWSITGAPGCLLPHLYLRTARMTQTPVGPSAGFLAGYRAHNLGQWWWLQFWKFCKNIFPYKRICIRVWMCSLCHLSPFGTAWFPVVRHKIRKPQPSILGPSAALLVLLSFHEFHKPHFFITSQAHLLAMSWNYLSASFTYVPDAICFS